MMLFSIFLCQYFWTLLILNEVNGHCGRPIGTEYQLSTDRIVAGYDVGYYRYPWYAAFIRDNETSCGGALIGPKTVITAAHCYREFLDLSSQGKLKLEDMYTVKMGVYNICISTEKTMREYKIEKVIVHEEYITKKPYFDVCIVILANETTQYKPICLPPPDLTKRPKEGTVPGLGTLRYKGSMPCTVHEARLLIYSDKECRDMMNRTGNDVTVMKNCFCAGYIQGGIDTCQGDSGGPLQILNESGDYVLLGIVSFGFRCANPGMLGMYTDVTQYTGWIKEKTGLKSNNGHKSLHANINNTTNAPSTVNQVVHGRPYHRPVRIIIYKNNHLKVELRNTKVIPIIRNNN